MARQGAPPRCRPDLNRGRRHHACHEHHLRYGILFRISSPSCCSLANHGRFQAGW
jgi:hypothetical protein